MRRIISSCVVLMLLTFASSQSVFAVPLSTRQATADAPLDLATMVLVPADVKNLPDAAIVSGAHYGIGAYTGRKANAVKAAGYVGGYETWIASAGSSGDRTYQIASALDEFKSAKSGVAGFEALAPSSRSDVGTKTIGKESHLYIFSGSDPYDRSKPDHGYILVFRVDRIVATVYVDDFTGKRPKVSEAEALGEVLATRIAKALAGTPSEPGMSTRMLRLDVPILESFQDNYFRLDGKDLFGAYYGDLPSGASTFDKSYPHATDVYFTGQDDTGDASSPTYFARMARFSSTYWAAKYVKNYLTGAGSGPNAWRHLTEIKGAQDFGDQSHTATFTIPAQQGAPGPTIYGTAIVARSGSTMVTIRVQAFKRVPVALVEGLMKTQMACLQSTARCPATEVPAGMDDLHLSSGFSSAGHLASRPAATFPAADLPLN